MSDNHSVFGAPEGPSHFWMNMTNAFAKRPELIWSDNTRPSNVKANEDWVSTVSVGDRSFTHGPTTTRKQAREGVAEKVLAYLNEL